MIEVEGKNIESKIGLCGIHIERTVVEDHKDKIVNTSFIDIAKEDVSILRNFVGSQCQFRAFAQIMLIE